MSAQFEQLIALQEERVELARRQVEETLRLQELETRKIAELQAQRRADERKLTQEAEWQRIEEERLARLESQAQQLAELLRIVQTFRDGYAETHHQPIMLKLNEILQHLTLLVERLIAAAFNAGKNDSNLNINVGGPTAIGDVRAGQDAHIKG